MHRYVRLSAGTRRGQEAVLDPVEQELQALMRLLMEIQLRSVGRAVRSLPASSLYFLKRLLRELYS